MKRLPTRWPDVYRSESGTFFYRGTPRDEHGIGTKQIEVSLNTTVEEEVDFLRSRLILEAVKSGVDAKMKRAGPLMQKYLEERQANPKNRESTKREIRDMLTNYLMPYFEKYRLSEITPKTWKRYVKHNGTRDYTNHRKVLVGFLKWCVEEEHLIAVPVFKLPDWDKRQRVILTEGEIIALFAHAVGDLLIYLAMYLFMGMRNSEIIKLLWDRVNLTDEPILYDDTLNKTTIRIDARSIYLRPQDTKTRRPRHVPINAFVLELLKARLALSESRWVFPNRDDKNRHRGTSGFVTAWETLIKRAKIRRHITPHDCRSTFETWASKRPEFTDAQREKMAGATMDTQKRLYIVMSANDVRGLEESVQFQELDVVLQGKIEKHAGEIHGEEDVAE